ncbi:hypothetical protein ACQ4LE_008035 [Meloidogyne hapla]|uniref:Uncharacterized protein n=1 Tax=Meloidogyne hapla TaxID=6305 RepID=A0A1I8B2B1_MELHA
MRPPLEHRGRNVLASDFMYQQRVGDDQPTDFQFGASQGRGVARVPSRMRAGAMAQRPLYGVPPEQIIHEPSDQPLPNTEFASSVSRRGFSSSRRGAGYGLSTSSGYVLTQQAQPKPTYVEEEVTNNHQQPFLSQMQVYGQAPSSSQALTTMTACEAHKQSLDVLIEGARGMANLLNDLANRLEANNGNNK